VPALPSLPTQTRRAIGRGILTASLRTKYAKRPLRRLAARPTLEPDLIAALGSSNAELADGTFLVVAAIPFQWSAALEAAIRAWIGRLADKICTVRRPGEDSDYDTYVDRWFTERLAAALAVSKKWRKTPGSI
jgi:hypothetical protein